MEFVLGFVLGVLVMMFLEDKISWPKKEEKAAVVLTEEEIRKAKKAAKEYENFLLYDGTVQDDVY